MDSSQPAGGPWNQSMTGGPETQHAASVADTMGSSNIVSEQASEKAKCDTITASHSDQLDEEEIQAYEAQYESLESHSEPLEDQNARSDQAASATSTSESVGEDDYAHSSFKLLDASVSIYREVLPIYTSASSGIVPSPQRSSRILPTSPLHAEVPLGGSTVSQSFNPVHTRVELETSIVSQESPSPSSVELNFENRTPSHRSTPPSPTLRPTPTVFQDLELQDFNVHNKYLGFKVDHSEPLQYDDSGDIIYDRSLPFSYGNRQYERGPQAYARMNGGLQPDVWTDWYCQGSALMPGCRTKNLLPFPPRKYIPRCWRCRYGSMFKKAAIERKVLFRAR
jgi:hypothetical protein